jgi:parallel beta-helix repeat protein
MNKRVVMLLLLISLPFITNSKIDLIQEENLLEPNMKLSALTPHAQIEIINDTDFGIQAALELWPGNGSQINPYIISNYSFDGGYVDDHGILIINTRVYFVIENCEFKDSQFREIYLRNVTNGKIINSLFNNTHTGNTKAIQVRDSSDILIANNTITNGIGAGSDGIYVHDSHDVTIEDNTLFDIYEVGINIYTNTLYTTFNINVSNNNTFYISNHWNIAY